MNAQDIGNSSQRTWILLAHRSGAKLLLSTGLKDKVKVVREFLHPEGRRRNQDIDHESKADHFDPGLDPQEDGVEHRVEAFAHDLAKVLRDGRTHKDYDHLLIAAEPGFLGKIRACLDKETARHVIGTLNHNLFDLPQRELDKHIRDMLIDCRVVA